ncbi:cytochrome P450 CYP12A2-like isoform X2 [Calliphora vicina]|uniref:cytochrome P450 CYP12A2-like isoform X2 n=1 Tax=Calliphora vicina TaxID=7373 RepID=UPI00325B92E1
MTGKILLGHQKWHKLALNQTISKTFQSTETIAATTQTNSFKQEWENARPFEEIPTQKKITGLFNFLPGGKYYKLDPTKLMLALKRDMGNITRFHGFFGRKDVVITHNVEDFIAVLRNEGIWPTRPGLDALQYHRHVYRADFFKGVEGIISTEGEKWATFRSAVNPVLMHPKNVRLYMHKMSQVNKEFVERIQQIRDPKTLEVPASFEDEMNRWTLESISVVALDKQLGLLNKNRGDPLAKELFQAITGFFKYGMEVEYSLPLWKLYKTKSFKNLMESLDAIMFTTSAYVNEAIGLLEQEIQKGAAEKPEQDKSVLEKLVKIDKRIATVMAMDMLMAGVDTTSSTFTGMLLCLAKNPDKQAKLRDEIMTILPNKDSEFTEESMKNVPYLRACIKESLRMYPITIGNTRVPANDVVLSGYRVPKGTQVSMVFTALVDDDKYFPRAKEFLPERWLRSEQDKGIENSSECPHALKPSSPFVYLPFGFGPRSCIGRRIVEMELELGIARVIRNFQVEYNYPTENAFKSLLINVPNIPLTFKFTDIEN